MAYSLNPSSDNCYEGTTCLVNKLGIRDEKRLSEVEAQITFAKAVMLEETPIDDDFGFYNQFNGGEIRGAFPRSFSVHKGGKYDFLRF